MSRRISYVKVAPDVVEGLSNAGKPLKSSNIDAKLRALVELRTSQINGCAYCVDLHSQEARKAGETQQRIDCLTVWRETTLYDDRERAALAWAEAVTRLGEHGVPDSVYDEVCKYFPEKDVVDLTMIVALMNAWNRMSISFKNVPPKRAE